jgi:hypothetical protein
MLRITPTNTTLTDMARAALEHATFVSTAVLSSSKRNAEFWINRMTFSDNTTTFLKQKDGCRTDLEVSLLITLHFRELSGSRRQRENQSLNAYSHKSASATFQVLILCVELSASLLSIAV